MTLYRNSVLSMLGGRWHIFLYFAALFVAISLNAARAQTPQQANQNPRPTAEQRKSYDERMMSIHPAKPGCFEAHYPDEQWVEAKCLPAPRTPNPHAQGSHPNTVGDGTDWFATVTSGNISQVTGSFDEVSGIGSLLGPINGNTSVLYPNAYSMQVNSNTFTPSICGSLTNCAWVQFVFSQTQCGSSPCVFIEYWLLNHTSPCPTNASWSFYNGSVPDTTPGCYLNTPATGLAAVPLTDLGSLRVIAKTQGGNDIVTVSDVNGTLGSVSNPSIANLGSGWTGVEYNLVGDCCATETFFSSVTPASLTLRVATVNGTTNTPNCAATFSGTTAESNNLNLTGGCTPAGGATPAIVFSESSPGPLPAGSQYNMGNNTTKDTPFVTSDGWVYFQGTDNALWKVRTDGTQQSKPGNNTTNSTPFVTSDGWIWFQGTDNALWKVRTDGTQQSKPGNNTTASSPVVLGNVVFFRGTDNKLWRMNTDGTGQNQINGNTTKDTPFVTSDGWVYFQGTDNALWKVRTDGTQQSKPGNNTTNSTPFVTSDGWIWFQGTDNALWKVRTDGTQQSKPGNNTTASSPVVLGNVVFFRGTDNKLWRMNTDGTGQVNLGNNTTLSTPTPTADSVSFRGTDDALWRYMLI